MDTAGRKIQLGDLVMGVLCIMVKEGIGEVPFGTPNQIIHLARERGWLINCRGKEDAADGAALIIIVKNRGVHKVTSGRIRLRIGADTAGSILKRLGRFPGYSQLFSDLAGKIMENQRPYCEDAAAR